jgi:excisionase family DNA binding protein
MSIRPTPTLLAIAPGQLLITLEDAARCLAISRAHLYRLLQRNELAAIRLGRSRRVVRSALEAYVERLVREQAGGAA